MIFWGTVGTFGALVYRDHLLTVAAKKRVVDKVDVLAKQTCGTQDMPRKVTVYIMPPPGDGIHKTRHYFRQFVKVHKDTPLPLSSHSHSILHVSRAIQDVGIVMQLLTIAFI
jgi:hypothetical protein